MRGLVVQLERLVERTHRDQVQDRAERLRLHDRPVVARAHDCGLHEVARSVEHTSTAQDFTPAFAQSTGAAPGGAAAFAQFLPIVLIFVVFYFLLIRPQQKKAKEHRAMIDAIEKGNEVVTSGGIVGRVSKLNDQFVTIEVAPGVEMTLQRQAISQLLPKGTIKAL